jgi:hypothetical protein
MSLEHSPARGEASSAQPLHGLDALLDEVAAGAYLGGRDNPISARTMQRWRFERTGPAFIRIGRLIRYRKSALEVFLAAGEQKPAA